MDPYVILTWRSNEQKSTVAKGTSRPTIIHKKLLIDSQRLSHLNTIFLEYMVKRFINHTKEGVKRHNITTKKQVILSSEHNSLL
jgi:hypothetical protein